MLLAVADVEESSGCLLWLEAALQIHKLIIESAEECSVLIIIRIRLQ